MVVWTSLTLCFQDLTPFATRPMDYGLEVCGRASEVRSNLHETQSEQAGDIDRD